MAAASLKKRIHDVLKRTAFSDTADLVDVSDDRDDVERKDVHVVVISPKFEGRHLGQRSRLIWSALRRGLAPKDWGRITLSIGVSPDQVNGASIDEIKVRSV